MKFQRMTFTAVLLGAIALSTAWATMPAQAQNLSVRAEVGVYYDELSPYGEWVDNPDYGWAWAPRNVGSSWRPYTEGRWVDSEYGWTWVSEEPFGWATYHYGRWAFDSRYGWIWVPGTVWGPAWVAWQHGNGYVGWAPLPPQIGFDVNVGLRFGGLSLSAIIQPNEYVFVADRGFLEHRVGRHAVPRARNAELWRRARNVTNYTVVQNRVINRGITVDSIERVTRHKVPRYRVADAADRRSVGVEKDRVRFYRPSTAKLRTGRVAVRNDAGVRPANRSDRREGRPAVRPETRGRRPEATPVRRPTPERRPEVKQQPPQSRRPAARVRETPPQDRKPAVRSKETPPRARRPEPKAKPHSADPKPRGAKQQPKAKAKNPHDNKPNTDKPHNDKPHNNKPHGKPHGG